MEKMKYMSEDIDLINKPPHYNQGDMEAIDYIKQQLGEGFKLYLEGACLKYLHRWKYKNTPIEDLKKCQFYLDKLIAEAEK
jgi:hypothetical protein